MTSGYSEDISVELTSNLTSPSFGDSNSYQVSSTLLLLIIIALCAVIILLVLFVLVFVCQRSLTKKKKCASSVQIVLATKATSTTGLNELRYGIESKNVTTTVLSMGDEKNPEIIAKEQISDPLNNTQINSQNKDYQKNLTKNQEECICLLQSEDSVSQSAISGVLSENKSAVNVNCKTDAFATTENFAPALVDEPKDKTDKEVDANESSPLTSNKVKADQPLDSSVPPQAWFVPLDEIYHEPLRHSFINMSNHDYLASIHAKNNLSLEEKQALCSNKNSGLMLDLATTPTDQNSGHEYLNENSCEGKGNWRDSGIPYSQSYLGRYNSSDLDKKPSLWDQREDRPVVFLGNTDKPSSPTLKSENT